MDLDDLIINNLEKVSQFFQKITGINNFTVARILLRISSLIGIWLLIRPSPTKFIAFEISYKVFIGFLILGSFFTYERSKFTEMATHINILNNTKNPEAKNEYLKSTRLMKLIMLIYFGDILWTSITIYFSLTLAAENLVACTPITHLQEIIKNEGELHD